MFDDTWYSWFIGKTLYHGLLLLAPLTFLGLPVNLVGLEGFHNFLLDNEKKLTSEQCADIFILLWMALPTATTWSWVNDFYMFPIQVIIEIILAYYGYHWHIHQDNNSYVEMLNATYWV